MEENLLKLFNLADLLNEKQNEVYAQLQYRSNDDKKLVIEIISKKDWTYVIKWEIYLNKSCLIKWDEIIELFERYTGGIINE